MCDSIQALFLRKNGRCYLDLFQTEPLLWWSLIILCDFQSNRPQWNWQRSDILEAERYALNDNQTEQQKERELNGAYRFGTP